MKRWWDNDTDAINALKVVDDSDVINGVGVAFLGYHAIAKSLLKPLMGQTLIDVHQVHKVLSEIDLSLVSKALGEATKPVMGEASTKYGELLAEAIHNRATEATERLLSTWTNTGMPWPNAIERAAEVHGVPSERLGKYASVMKAASVAPTVKQDYADRELMAYASHIGKLESTADNTFISKQMKVKFNEEDHPRNPDGKFRDKDATVTQIKEKQEKLDKLNRLNRLNQINAKNKMIQTSIKQKPQTELKQEKLKEFNIKERQISNIKLKQAQLKNKINIPAAGAKPTESDFTDPPGEIRPWVNEVFGVIGREEIDKIRVDMKGEFYAGQLENPLQLVSREYLRDYIALHFGTLYGFEKANMTILRCMEPPVLTNSMENVLGRAHEDINRDTDFAIASNKAKFKIGQVLFVDLGDIKDKNAPEEPTPTVFASNENADYFDFLSKSLQGNQLLNFNEEHPRSEDGRFKDKINEDELKRQQLDKLNRLNRLNNINAQNRAAQMKRLIESNQQAHNKVALAQAKLKENNLNQIKLSNQRIANAQIRNTLLHDNKNPAENIDLADKFALVLGYDVLGYLGDNTKDNLEFLKNAINNPKHQHVVSYAPFFNENLVLNEDEDYFVAVEPAYWKTVEYADNYKAEQGDTGAEYFWIAENGKKIKFAYDYFQDIEQVVKETKPQDLDNNYVWEPEMLTNNYNDSTLDSTVSIKWIGREPSSSIQIILGNEDDFAALQAGYAKLEPVSGVGSLTDLMSKTKYLGKSMTEAEAYDLAATGGEANVGTNPPVYAFTIK